MLIITTNFSNFVCFNLSNFFLLNSKKLDIFNTFSLVYKRIRRKFLLSYFIFKRMGHKKFRFLISKKLKNAIRSRYYRLYNQAFFNLNISKLRLVILKIFSF